ncbi:MAG TPA: hypothetical protein VMN79_20435 [Casimicrobiaceae bacterium]|nr:hypothetical protein [Casimicrobiaceae bacterium]
MSDTTPSLPSYTVDVHKGRESATVMLSGSPEFTTAQLSELIAVMAKVRAQMLPMVPAESGQQFHFEINPPLTVIACVAGGAILGIRHPGYGWIYAQLPHDEVQRIADYLRKVSVAPPPSPKSKTQTN